MAAVGSASPSGPVFRVERVRRPVWYAKYRLPYGRQIQDKLGPAWTQRGRPPTGRATRRSSIEPFVAAPTAVTTGVGLQALATALAVHDAASPFVAKRQPASTVSGEQSGRPLPAGASRRPAP